MFFKTDTSDGSPRNGGLPWDPFKAIVAPRPIGWITTISPEGVVNLAPYSYFNAIADKPNLVYFSSNTPKHSQRNAELSGEFVCSLANWETHAQMNHSSAEFEPDVSEPDAIGLEMAPSHLVKPPRVAASPAALECVYLETYVPRTRAGREHDYHLVFGEVVGIYLDESLVHEGRLDTAAMRPVARLGYDEYAVVEESFRLPRPDVDMLDIMK